VIGVWDAEILEPGYFWMAVAEEVKAAAERYEKESCGFTLGGSKSGTGLEEQKFFEFSVGEE
jgi:hypothetical protein